MFPGCDTKKYRESCYKTKIQWEKKILYKRCIKICTHAKIYNKNKNASIENTILEDIYNK